MPRTARKSDGTETSWRDFTGTGTVLCLFGLIGTACLVSQSRVPLPEASLMAFAATCVGIAVGFLMGTPPSPSDTGGQTASDSSGTHLEQISDWLTKVLVGAGLVQLGKIPGALQSMADTVHAANGLESSAVVCILVSFVVLGFFIGYLATRLFLAGAFDRAADIKVSAQVPAGADGAQAIVTVNANEGATAEPVPGNPADRATAPGTANVDASVSDVPAGDGTSAETPALTVDVSAAQGGSPLDTDPQAAGTSSIAAGDAGSQAAKR